MVNPGNWGRILRMYTQQGSPNPWILTRELIYELVRVRSFPAKPSRLDCLFVCMSETDLTAFRANAGRIFDIGYEVELVDPQASNHLGDWSAANSQPTANMPAYENSAHLYWQGVGITKPELATMSPVRIIRVLP